MNTVTELIELRVARAQLSEPVGLIPTMGFLHEGHLSLVKYARQECASVVASIFINPTQFSPEDDLETYPRDMPHDLDLLKAEGVDLVWHPSPEIIYPPDFQTWVSVERLTKFLEGVWRPGHFRGVTTIVAKLFNAILPQIAYFGQKDAQQAIVIQQMVRDLNFPIQIKICPIIREADGLAMSSRNFYLDVDQRKAATVLSRSLAVVKNAFESGISDAGKLRQVMMETLQGEPLAKVHYISIANPETLAELNYVENNALFSMAVTIGKTRLIDNYLLQNGLWMTGQRIGQASG